MKRFYFTMSLFLMLFSALSAEDIRTVTVTNSLSEAIYYLYMTPEDQSDWGDDRLGDDILDPGDSISIDIDIDFWGSEFRLMAEDETEKAFRIDNIDLNETDSLSITEDDYLPFGGRSPVTRTLTFYNDTDEDIYYLYVSSNSSMYWGEDILGDEILYYGEYFTLDLPIDSEYPRHDILAEGSSGSSYELIDMNLMELDELTFTVSDMTSSGDDYDYDYDDYEYDDYDDEYGPENDPYLEGYREGFKEGWSEAYQQGYEDGLSRSLEN